MERSYVLNYFPVCGIAESCRMAFHVAGVKFVDNQIEFDDWFAEDGRMKNDGKCMR